MTVTRRTVIAGLGALAGAAAGIAKVLTEPAAPLVTEYWEARPYLHVMPEWMVICRDDGTVTEWVPFDDIEEIRERFNLLHEAILRARGEYQFMLPIDSLPRPNPYLDAV